MNEEVPGILVDGYWQTGTGWDGNRDTHGWWQRQCGDARGEEDCDVDAVVDGDSGAVDEGGVVAVGDVDGVGDDGRGHKWWGSVRR